MRLGLYTMGVYFLIKDMDVIYIGESIQMELRIRWHEIRDFDHYVMIPTRNRKKLERKMIRLIKPTLNKMHKGKASEYYDKLEKQLV